ncbi:MAG TPA: murein biosynthesis integral membrane protein MurJ [Steroidobacteraceae bacterium]|nr:murein biosynthesis integral membrane protein MurJ [Steroidobacteraceae bacterium]
MSRAFLRSTGVVGATTLVSRITGLLRDMALSQVFGAGLLMDAFLVAYKIPNFLRRLFAEGAFSQSFVPVISEFRVKRAHGEVRDLVGGTAGTLGMVLFVVTLIGVIGAPVLILLFAPGFTQHGDKYDLAVDMLRWTFPYLFFVSLTALCSGVLNSYGRFAVPAFTQVIMNVVMIFFAVVLAANSANPGIVLAIGVFVSGVLQVLFQLPAVAKLGLLAWPRWQPRGEGVRRIGRLMVPGIVGSSMAQVSLLLDTIIASFLMSGSISWLYFADRLMEFPLGVFSIALATVILPGLSAQHAEASMDRFAGTLDWALRLTVLLAAPAAVGLLFFAGPLTATVFGYGQFSSRDVQMAAYALMAYSWGLLMFSIVKVLAPGYYARQDTRTPVRVAIIGFAVTMSLNVVVVLPAKWLGFPIPHVLLATSTCAGAAVNAFLLWRGLRRAGVYRASAGWGRFLARVLTANAAMAALLWWFTGDLDTWTAMGALQRALRCAIGITAAAGLYFAVLFVSGLRYGDLRNRPI